MSSKSEIQKAKRSKLIQILDSFLEAKGQEYMVAYFSADENYQVNLKVVDEQLKAFLSDENIRQINEIDYDAVKETLTNSDHKNNLQYNKSFLEQAVKTQTGIDLNPLCCGYFGPHKNPTRGTQRYNAYSSLYFKTSDLSELLSKNDLSFPKDFISINDLLDLCWELLKNDALVVEVSAGLKKVKRRDKDAVLEKKQLRNRLAKYLDAYLKAKGQKYMVAYFKADENYQVNLKMVGNQLQAFLSEHNIRQINEIHYEEIKQVLTGNEHKNNLENKRLLLQQAIQRNTSVALNTLCMGYLGPHKSPSRKAHSYNAYDTLCLKTSDLDEFLSSNHLSFSKAFITINELLTLCWELLKNNALVVEVSLPQKEEVKPKLESVPAPKVFPEVIKDNKEVSELEVIVNKALECLDFADLAAYFVTVDAIVPPRLLAMYNQVKNEYILQGSSAGYLERLKVFTHSLLFK